MKTIKVSYIRINEEYRVIEYNMNFINFFKLDFDGGILGKLIYEIIPGINRNTYLKLYSLRENEKKSLIVFRNYRLNKVTEPLVTILYIAIIRVADTLVIKVTNWLNWIWHLNLSLNQSYKIITGMDDNIYRRKITKLVEMYWFKALSPLLTHIPKEFIGMVNAWAVYDILKVFNNKRGKNIFSKDYNRDTISRIRCSIRRDCGINAHVDVCDILKDNQLINLRYGHELFIPHSELSEDIILVADRDILLENMMGLLVKQDDVILNQKEEIW